MDKTYKILVINPGSTSTKVAIYENEKELNAKTLEHSAEELAKFPAQIDQLPFRMEAVKSYIAEQGMQVTDFDAFVARGGSYSVFKAGAYQINEEMVDAILHPAPGRTPGASWNATLIANELSKEAGVPAYIYDAVSVDEMEDVARLSGLKEIPRKAAAHTLNTKAVARSVAEKAGSKYEEKNYVITHMGGGISTSAHKKGRIVDMVADDEGTFSPERAGKVPCQSLVDLCYSGKYTYKEMKKMMRGKGGIVSYLGVNGCKDVEAMIKEGNKEAEQVYDALAYQIAKDIGSMAAVLSFELDGIILTGGIAYSEMFTGMVKKYVEKLSEVTVVPGSFEMEALAKGALRVLKGEEGVNTFVRE